VAGRKKKAEEPKGSSLAWLFTFSDVLTLLMTFFVLLISMSSMDSKALRNTFGFFNGALANLSGAKRSKGSAAQSGGATGRPMPTVTVRPQTVEGGTSDQMKKRLAMIARLSRDLAKRLAAANRPGVTGAQGLRPLDWGVAELLAGSKPIEVVRLKGRVEVELHVALLFEAGSAVPRKEAQQVVYELRALAKLGRKLKRIETPVAEHGKAVKLFSPWTLAAWRSAALVRRLGVRATHAAAISTKRKYIHLVLENPLKRKNAEPDR